MTSHPTSARPGRVSRRPGRRSGQALLRVGVGFVPLLFALGAAAAGEPGAAGGISPPTVSLPDAGVSLLRVLGALAVVLAVFLGGVWLFRNWQRLTIRRGRLPRLNVLEGRSLGGRHVLYVVGYEQERFLIAASPGGVHLVSHLQSAGEESPEPAPAPHASFTQALSHMLRVKTPIFGRTGALK